MFKKLTIILCLFSLGCSFVGDQKPILSKPLDEFDSFQIRLLELHNNERVKKGMSKLTIDKNLSKYAQKHAETMAQKDNLFHSKMSDLMRVNLDANIVGENVAWGQETEASVVSSWMWSPTHRWNILGSSYSRAGFGMKEGKNSRKYWCVVFSN